MSYFDKQSRSIKSLRRQAARSAAYRGHSMRWEMETDYAIGTCRHCGKCVVCLTKPAPNEIDIGGEAVALGCLEKR